MEARNNSQHTNSTYSFTMIAKLYAAEWNLPFTDVHTMEEYFKATKVDRAIIKTFYNISTLPTQIQFNINGLQKNWLSWFPNDYHFLLLHTALYSLHKLIVNKKITEESACDQFLDLYKKLCVPEFFFALMLPNLSSSAHLSWFADLTESLTLLSPKDPEITQISQWLKGWRSCEDFINNNSIKKMAPQYVSGDYFESSALSDIAGNNRPNFIGGNFSQILPVSGIENFLNEEEQLSFIKEFKKQEVELSLKKRLIFNEKINLDPSMKELIIKVFEYYYDLKFANKESFIIGKYSLINMLSKLYFELLDSIKFDLRFKSIITPQNSHPFWNKDNALNVVNLKENEKALLDRVMNVLSLGYRFNIEFKTGVLYPNNGIIKIIPIDEINNEKKLDSDLLNLILGFCPIASSKDWVEILDDKNVLRISTDLNRMQILYAELIKACENIKILSPDFEAPSIRYTCNIS